MSNNPPATFYADFRAKAEVTPPRRLFAKSQYRNSASLVAELNIEQFHLGNKVMIKILGHAVSFIAKSVGWTPIGKTVIFSSCEGPITSALVGKEATVQHLFNSPNESSSGIITVTLQEPIRWKESQVNTFLLIPRHVGFNGFSLLFTGIACAVALEDPSKTPDDLNSTDIVGIAGVRLA